MINLSETWPEKCTASATQMWSCESERSYMMLNVRASLFKKSSAARHRRSLHIIVSTLLQEPRNVEEGPRVSKFYKHFTSDAPAHRVIHHLSTALANMS